MTRDRGSAAVELALALPAVVMVLAWCLAAVQAAGTGLVAPAAALAGARAGVVGADDAAVAAALAVAGDGAQVGVDRGGGWVAVTVGIEAAWPWPDRVARVALPAEP